MRHEIDRLKIVARQEIERLQAQPSLFRSEHDELIGEDLFRHLVISRLAFPLSKLKTTEYLYRYQGKTIDVDAIYRFLDKLSSSLKPAVEEISYKHTLRKLNDNVSVVFYDMTTLYFEASDEDDLRKMGNTVILKL
jgi:hypothetical protein